MTQRILSILVLLLLVATPFACLPCDSALPQPEGEGSSEGHTEPEEGEAQPSEGEEENEEGETAEGETGSEGETTPPRSATTDCFGECTFEIINTFPHDPAAFTQGLDFEDGYLYEGTGLECCTWLRKVELETGAVVQHIDVPEAFCTNQRLPACGGQTQSCAQARTVFGEGVVIFGNEIIQLTWQNCVGFVYDKETFAFKRAFSYEHEGWGITHDGQRLIVSDGSDKLRFWDPYTYLEIGSVAVTYNGAPLNRINELEYIDGAVFANVWETNYIVRIDPHSGEVTARIDLSGILAPSDRTPNTDVLNGIAYDPVNDRLFVTGKRWPKLFEIALHPAR